MTGLLFCFVFLFYNSNMYVCPKGAHSNLLGDKWGKNLGKAAARAQHCNDDASTSAKVEIQKVLNGQFWLQTWSELLFVHVKIVLV